MYNLGAACYRHAQHATAAAVRRVLPLINTGIGKSQLPLALSPKTATLQQICCVRRPVTTVEY